MSEGVEFGKNQPLGSGFKAIGHSIRKIATKFDANPARF